MAKWIPTILAALLAALTAAAPDVQVVVKDNPLASTFVALLLTIVAALAQSPLGKRPQP